MSKKLTKSFTREQLELVAQQAAKLAMSGMFQPPNLDSGIDSASTDTFGEENPKVSTRRIQESTNSFPAIFVADGKDHDHDSEKVGRSASAASLINQRTQPISIGRKLAKRQKAPHFGPFSSPNRADSDQKPVQNSPLDKIN